MSCEQDEELDEAYDEKDYDPVGDKVDPEYLDDEEGD